MTTAIVRTRDDARALGARCDVCPLAERAFVPPLYATGRVRLVIVGESPGRMEAARGVPFIGPSGALLNKLLNEAGFHHRDRDAHVTNASLCRPDDDTTSKVSRECCAPRLARELEALPPKALILALGAPASRSLLGTANIMKGRGFVWRVPPPPASAKKAKKAKKASAEVPAGVEPVDSHACRRLLEGRTVIPTLHPAFLLRGADTWRPVLGIDIKRAVRWIRYGGLKLSSDGPYIVVTSAVKLRRELAKFGPGPVDIDVETDGADPMECAMQVLGFAEMPKSPTDAVRVVVANPWRVSMVKVVNAFLKRRVAITHNGPAFDEMVLNRHGVFYTKKEDTLIAHHAFASHLRQGADHVASVYCDSGPWKLHYRGKNVDEKGGFGISAEDLSPYNATDVRNGVLSWMGMQRDLASERKVYEADMAMADICRRMTEAGIGFDLERAKALSKKMRFRENALLGAMRLRTKNPEFHPRRLVAIREAIYQGGKIRPFKLTPTGMPATDKEVLEIFRTQRTEIGQLCDQILRWRSTSDTRVEYLDAVKPGGDGRVHPSWRSFGTECLKRGTQISCVFGPTSVEDIAVGALVITHRGRLRRVIATSVNAPQPIYHVRLKDGSALGTNGAHPYLTVYTTQRWAAQRWVAAASLQIGDLVVTYRDGWHAYSEVVSIEVQASEPTYGLTVEEDHSHVTNGIVTHNTGRPATRRPNFLNTPRMEACASCGVTLVDGVGHKPFCKKPSVSEPESQIRDCYVTKQGYRLQYFDLCFATGTLIDTPTGHVAIDKLAVGGLVYTYREATKRPAVGRVTQHLLVGRHHPVVKVTLDNGEVVRCTKEHKWIVQFSTWELEDRKAGDLNSGDRLLSSSTSDVYVASVEDDGFADVWSIAVDPDHNYALAAGVFVKNSQAESRFAAHLSGDDTFINACKKDVHAGNAMVLFPDAKAILEEDPKGKGKRFRDIAKTAGFAVAYGSAADSVFAKLRGEGFAVTLDDVEAMLGRLKRSYWKYYAFADANVAYAQRYGHLRSCFLGRIRWTGWHPKPTVIYNYPIQSGVADVMNMRIIALDRRLPKLSKIIAYMYDALVVETPVDESVLVQSLIKEQWEEPIIVPHNGISFVQKIDQKEGERWSDFA